MARIRLATRPRNSESEFRFSCACECGARDQSFRLIVRPDIWGSQMRLRLSNVFGTAPVTFDAVFAGVQMSGCGAVAGHESGGSVPRVNSVVTIAPGESAWSDPVSLPFVSAGKLAGRKLAVSFHVAGESGPMTWHAKALTTSYLSMRSWLRK